MPDIPGIFETIAVFHSRPIFLQQHLNRLEEGLMRISLLSSVYQRDEAEFQILKAARKTESGALKLEVTADAMKITSRANPYSIESYQRGFRLCYSSVLRDESDPVIYVKSLERSILNKERSIAKGKGFDEALFLNRKGEVSEGSVSNVFCVKNDRIYTSSISSGLLNGILRQYLLLTYDHIRESVLFKDDIIHADEVFLTNSLMGIMPVCAVDGIPLKDHSVAEKYQKQYLKNLSEL